MEERWFGDGSILRGDVLHATVERQRQELETQQEQILREDVLHVAVERQMQEIQAQREVIQRQRQTISQQGSRLSELQEAILEQKAPDFTALHCPLIANAF